MNFRNILLLCFSTVSLTYVLEMTMLDILGESSYEAFMQATQYRYLGGNESEPEGDPLPGGGWPS